MGKDEPCGCCQTGCLQARSDLPESWSGVFRAESSSSAYRPDLFNHSEASPLEGGGLGVWDSTTGAYRGSDAPGRRGAWDAGMSCFTAYDANPRVGLSADVDLRGTLAHSSIFEYDDAGAEGAPGGPCGVSRLPPESESKNQVEPLIVGEAFARRYKAGGFMSAGGFSLDCDLMKRRFRFYGVGDLAEALYWDEDHRFNRRRFWAYDPPADGTGDSDAANTIGAVTRRFLPPNGALHSALTREGLEALGLTFEDWLAENIPLAPFVPPVIADLAGCVTAIRDEVDPDEGCSNVLLMTGWVNDGSGEQEGKPHHCFDIRTAPINSHFPIHAMADGTVVWRGFNVSQGNVLIIDYENGGRTWRSAYYHLVGAPLNDYLLSTYLTRICQRTPSFDFCSEEDIAGRNARSLLVRQEEALRNGVGLLPRWGDDTHRMRVQVGDRVRMGQVVAFGGTTGVNSGSIHLHLVFAKPVGEGLWHLFDPYGIYRRPEWYTGLYPSGPIQRSIFAPIMPCFAGISSSIFLLAVDYYKRIGWDFRTLSPYPGQGGTRWSGLFVKGPVDRTAGIRIADFRRITDVRAAEGKRARFIDVNVTDGTLSFVWERSFGRGANLPVYVEGATIEEMARHVGRLHGQSVLVDVTTYSTPEGARRCCYVLDRPGGSLLETVVFHEVRAAELSGLTAVMFRSGFIPYRLAVNEDAPGRRLLIAVFARRGREVNAAWKIYDGEGELVRGCVEMRQAYFELDSLKVFATENVFLAACVFVGQG